MLKLLFCLLTLNFCSCFNVTDVKMLNENILDLMSNANQRNESVQMIRMIALYSGGMCGNRLCMEQRNTEEHVWKIGKDIYDFGKPEFLEFDFDLENKSAKFNWNEEDKIFFNNIISDANSAWNDFEKIFAKVKHKYLSSQKS
uniref:Lipoprotein n=1 Tax=Graphocephala atropunctata TaxID=36148 RepID=A0A1B6KLL5_9HEMI